MNLKQLRHQLVSSFGSLDSSHQKIAALLLVAVVVSIAYLFLAEPNSGSGEWLLGGREFSSSEVAAVQQAFADAGLNEFELDGYRIRVPRTQRHEYLRALAGKVELEDPRSNIEKALQSDGIWISGEHRQQRVMAAKERQVGELIGQSRGIEYAVVSYDQTEDKGLRRQVTKSALASIKAYGDRQLDVDEVESFRSMVAANWSGLAGENVTIYDINAKYTYPGRASGGSLAASQDVYASRKRMYQSMWEESIRQTLAFIPGVRVGTNVELDPSLGSSSIDRKYDQKPVTLGSLTTTETRSLSHPAATGRPGTFANEVGNVPRTATQVATTSANAETSEKSVEQVHSVSGETTAQSQTAPLVPQTVTATVSIPRSYYRRVWQERHPAKAGQSAQDPGEADLKQIELDIGTLVQDIVVKLLPPKPPGDNVYEPVVVSTYDDIPLTAVDAPVPWHNALYWLQENWPTMGMMLLAAIGLVMVRNATRSPKGQSFVEPAIAAATTRPQNETGDDLESEVEKQILTMRRDTPAPDLRSELEKIIQQDFDAAARVLSNWINEGA